MVVGGWYNARLNRTSLVSLEPSEQPVPSCLKSYPADYPDYVNSVAAGSINNGKN